jgi:hypothetical protein
LGKNEIYDKELPHSWTDYLDDYTTRNMSAYDLFVVTMDEIVIDL